MLDIKINNVLFDVVENLAIIAKRQGYKSRDAFLREELQKIVRRYWREDTPDLEQILLSKTLKVIEMNTDVMADIIRQQHVQNPFHIE